MKSKSWVSWIEGLALLVILGLGAVLRFGWSGISSFALDEARISLSALQMARGETFVTLGTDSSVGVPFPPAGTWAFVPPHVFSSDPLFVGHYVGLLGLLTIIGVWWLARRWGVSAGLTAALFMAASPYAIFYTRSIWQPNLLPPLALAWGLAGYTASISTGRKQSWLLALHIFLAGLTVQVHFAGAALLLADLWMVFRWRWWLRPLPILLGGLIAALLLIPYINEIACCRADVFNQVREVSDGARIDLDAAHNQAQMAIGVSWQDRITGTLDTFGDYSIPALPVAVIMLGGVLALVAMLFEKPVIVAPSPPVEQTQPNTPYDLELQPEANPQRVISKQRILAEWTLIWLLVSPLFFLAHSSPVISHYQLVALPALALLAGASTQLISDRFWQWGVTLFMFIIALIWGAMITTSFSIAGEVETPNGLGTPLRNTRDAAYAVPSDAPAILFTHGDIAGVDGEATAFMVLWYDRPNHRIVPGESILILPPYPAYLVGTLQPFQAWEELEASNLARDVVAYPRREGALPIVMTRYNGESAPEGFTLIAPIVFEDGAQLEGWRARRVGPRLRISTLWRVMSAPPSGTFQQFHHLRTAATLEGEPFMGSDVPLATHDWQVGDRIIVMGDFFVEGDGEFWVDIGHYSLPDVQRILRVDGGDSVRLGTFTNAP